MQQPFIIKLYFVLRNLREGTTQHRRLAAENLAQVIYPDDQEIANALEELKNEF
ncbi:MAG: hypothetical protein AAGF66_07045 [Cyanobacteria bacterium P01_H01_bin.119]